MLALVAGSLCHVDTRCEFFVMIGLHLGCLILSARLACHALSSSRSHCLLVGYG